MMLSSLIGQDNFSKRQDVEIIGISSDSRLIKEGYIFAALPGSKLDGRDFIPQAINNGAAAILSLPGLPKLPVPVISDNMPARAYAELAAKIWPKQPDIMVAITGTNGKSSSIEFLRQIWTLAGYNSASFGTIGVTTIYETKPLSHTTPDAAQLHQILTELKNNGVSHAAMEASSHGLCQYRLDGVNLSAVGFTNLSQDHFDYHTSFEDYFQAKARLFNTLAKPDTPAIIMVDDEYGERMAKIAKAAGLDVMEIGFQGKHIIIKSIKPHALGQEVVISLNGENHGFNLALSGEFQVFNVITALGLALKTGVRQDMALSALPNLSVVAGRMQLVGTTKTGASVYVDYAHTPDALEKLLQGLRPHTQADLHVIFGCGGDRDKGKRAKMGKIACDNADKIIVTDDNPRTENAKNIRAEIMSACPNAIEIGDRRKAIHTAIANLQAGDVLVIAGKGHEQGQIVGTEILPFDDADVAKEVLS